MADKKTIVINGVANRAFMSAIGGAIPMVLWLQFAAGSSSGALDIPCFDKIQGCLISLEHLDKSDPASTLIVVMLLVFVVLPFFVLYNPLFHVASLARMLMKVALACAVFITLARFFITIKHFFKGEAYLGFLAFDGPLVLPSWPAVVVVSLSFLVASIATNVRVKLIPRALLLLAVGLLGLYVPIDA